MYYGKTPLTTLSSKKKNCMIRIMSGSAETSHSVLFRSDRSRLRGGFLLLDIAGVNNFMKYTQTSKYWKY